MSRMDARSRSRSNQNKTVSLNGSHLWRREPAVAQTRSHRHTLLWGRSVTITYKKQGVSQKVSPFLQKPVYTGGKQHNSESFLSAISTI